MKNEIEKMHKVWHEALIEERSRTELPSLNFNELISSIFTTGPFYYYIIDFFDMSISQISSGFASAHGISPDKIKNINDILALVHPDDMPFIAKAEEKSIDFIYKELGADKVTYYKASYNLRFKTADGSYRLYNHQSLALTSDENGNFIKTINIHTDISHISQRNNYKYSLIGLGGEPSYLNLDISDEPENANNQSTLKNLFTKRETEIIKQMTKGASSKQISENLYISPETVKSHRKNILTKSGCKNVAELVARSLSEGWI